MTDRIMDGDNRAQGDSAFTHHLIEQVHEGMRVFDSTGKEIGKVDDVRMGDPAAVTTQGQDPVGMTPEAANMARRTTILNEDDDDEGPELPAPFRKSMIRMGYIKVESGGFLGIGEKEWYVRADLIAGVAGDRVTLAVPEDELPREHDDRDPLDT